MRYDPAVPVAVFLGPSLSLEQARRVLQANYYPPIRMGDVYRLLATGVGIIAIIDGVFHQSSPVWQREILSALDEGIQVIGGASIGALRAAELAPYGMLGIGAIFCWYRDGLIDGDDEVALLHGDVTSGYRALSEPLVNMRFNLGRACARGLINEAECEELLAEAQRACFTERSWHALRHGVCWSRLPVDRQRSLQAFIDAQLENIKQNDALMVLEHCARSACPEPRAAIAERWSYPGTVRTQMQCAVAPDGALVSAAKILRKAALEQDWRTRCERAAREQFFLLDYMESHQLAIETKRFDAQIESARELLTAGDEVGWRRRNGITAQELNHQLLLRARIAWLRAQDPRAAGLSFEAQLHCVAALAVATGSRPQAVMGELAVHRFLTEWARVHGIDCPAQEIATRSNAWEREMGLEDRDDWFTHHALPREDFLHVAAARSVAEWLLDRGPYYFGYLTWSAEVSMLHELRFEHRYSALVASVAAEATDVEAASAA